MRVRVKKWREATQPEWPEVASGQGPSGAEGRTQAFPETGGTRMSVHGASGIPSQSARSAAVTGGAERVGGGERGLPDPGRADILASGGESRRRTEAVGRIAAVRDPWEESAAAGSGQDASGASGPPEGDPAHDPHEVTVQLDDVGRLEGSHGVRSPERQSPVGQDEGAVVPGGGQDGSDGPVFVDESGRRSRRFRRMGIAVGLACGVYAVVIVVTLLSGNSNAPWLPVPGQAPDKPADKVDSPPLPAASALPSGTGGIPLVPGRTAGPGGTTAPAPGATAPGATTSPGKPGKAGKPGKPGAPAGPKPSPTGTVTEPGTGPTEPTPTATATVTDPVVTPTPTDPGPPTTPPPTQTTGPVDSPGPGTAPVADGPNDPAPVATESPTTDPAASAPAPAPSTAPVT
ncbi:hypothetical protein [Streptomyces cellulosae]|uniref:Translation initiation factor IF-2 n=1 Tax=Streptomyces cellulosae TaxID=1968 RepID=A0ABW7YH90_STRCE